MTTLLRLESVRMETTAGPVVHEFLADLTVLAG